MLDLPLEKINSDFKVEQLETLNQAMSAMLSLFKSG